MVQLAHHTDEARPPTRFDRSPVSQETRFRPVAYAMRRRVATCSELVEIGRWPGVQPSYVLRGEHNAIIILHEGQPATVLPIDPSKPIDWPDDTPEEAYQMLRAKLEKHVQNLQNTDP